MNADVVHAITRIHPHRSRRLFAEFLPRGYDITALRRKGDGAPPPQATLERRLLGAKVMLGSLITFQDDLADHPLHFDPEALDFLYGLNASMPQSSASRERVRVASLVADAFQDALALLPDKEHYAQLLRFDLDQFRSANRYGALLRLHEGLANVTEARHFGPFNMGMVAAGTIDLMGMGPLAPGDLAAVREALYLGQRAARISNVVATLGREQAEGDLTNEISIATLRGAHGGAYVMALLDERHDAIAAIEALSPRCDAVDLCRYARSVEALHQLHLEFEGTI